MREAADEARIREGHPDRMLLLREWQRRKGDRERGALCRGGIIRRRRVGRGRALVSQRKKFPFPSSRELAE